MRTTGGMLHPILIGIALMLAGCAMSPDRPEGGAWTCDPKADAAVNADNWQTAQQLHRQFITSNPDNCLAIYHLGYIFGKMHDRSQEVSAYERAVACGYIQDDKLFFNLGMAYSELANSKKAIDAMKRAVRINPRDAENHFGLGYIAKLNEQNTVAEEALVKAIALSSRHMEARILLARIYLDQSRLSEAEKQLSSVLKREPDNEDAHHLWKIYLDRKMTSYEN